MVDDIIRMGIGLFVGYWLGAIMTRRAYERIIRHRGRPWL